MYGCGIIVQLCALYYAFQTRKVKVKGLNDAKYTAMVVYIVTTLLVVAVAGRFIFINYITLYSTFYGGSALITATTILGVMFIPKVYL